RFPRRKRADGRVQDAAAGHVHEQRDRDRLQAPVGLEGLELVGLAAALPGGCAPAPAQRELVKGAAVFPVALEAPGDRAAATVVFARQLALRDLRHQPEEDQVVERGPAQAAVDTEGLLREGALAALALVALDHAAVADAAEGAAALVLGSLSAVALGTLTWAEGGLEWHRRVLRGEASRARSPGRRSGQGQVAGADRNSSTVVHSIRGQNPDAATRRG